MSGGVNYCTPCFDSDCYDCGANMFNCTICNDNAPNGVWNGECVSCFDTHCRYCSENASICQGCMSGYGYVNSTCMSCSAYDNLCIYCNSSDITQCTNCITGYGVYLNNYTCISCTVYCLTCATNDA